MNDVDDPGWDAEARHDLARLNEAFTRWAEETGDRLGMPQAGGAGRTAPHRPRASTALEGGTVGRPGRPRSGARRWAWPSGILAAAAAMVVILLAREPGRRAPPPPAEGGIPLAADGLDAASDRPFMVVPTRNPDIAVIWMLDSGD